ncbi:MAG: hypothetical protein F2667_08640 [Actinobacteria bacterium]|nr:hypothetical protein [Actinomycetota bacterium]
MGRETRDAPVADKVATTTSDITPEGGAMVLPTDSTLGVGLVSAVDNRDYYALPIAKQATAKVTLSWAGASTFGLLVNGGSGQKLKEGDGTITVLVPWARRDLSITVDPQQILEPTTYTLTAELTTVKADKDRDGVPDVADKCATKAGPSVGGGCPDTDGDGMFDTVDACPTAASASDTGCPTKADERVQLIVDGTVVATRTVVTQHGAMPFAMSELIGRGAHQVVIAWIRDGKVVDRVSRTV